MLPAKQRRTVTAVMMASQSDPGPRFKSVQVIESSPPPQEESAWSLRGLVRILSGNILIGASSPAQPERDVDVNVTNTRFVPFAGGGNRWQATADKAVVTLHPGSGTASSHAASDIEAGEALRRASRSSKSSGLSPVVSLAELARTGNAAASVTWDSGSRESAERYRPKRHVGTGSTFPSDLENSVPDTTDIK